MKVIRLFSVIALCAGLLTACSKQESSTPQAPEATKPAAAVEKQAEAAKPAAQDAAASATSNAQSMIDKAKALIADNKYSEAMDLLKKLSSMQLTPEQKQLVNDLMAQVQKAMAGAAASDATKSVGGLLGK
jgi:outer membrane PBP1 activator LpoA protein